MYFRTALSKRNLAITTQVIKGEGCRIVGEGFSLSRSRVQGITLQVCKELSGLFIDMYGSPKASSLGWIRNDRDLWLEVIKVNQEEITNDEYK